MNDSINTDNNGQDFQCSFSSINFKDEANIEEQLLHNFKSIKFENLNNYEEKPTAAISKDEFDINKNLLKRRKNILNNKNNNKKKASLVSNNQKEKKISIEIKENIKKIKKKPGRKTKMNPNLEHNKFSDDNLRRKCKHFLLKYLLKFINDDIKNIYKNNIGCGILKKELQTINQSQKSDATVNFNKALLKKTIGEIFSEDISRRYTIYPLDHNKNIINSLMNEKNENIKIHFTKLFNLTFDECLKHFIEKEQIDELLGLKCFSQIKDEILKKYPQDGNIYYDNLKFYYENYGDLLDQKKARKSRKEKEKEKFEQNYLNECMNIF